MIECTSDSVTVSSVDRREIGADFLGGRLASKAGILLLKEVDRKLRLLHQDATNDPVRPLYRNRSFASLKVI